MQQESSVYKSSRRGESMLKVKYYKTGENHKLVPRYNGPRTVLRKLPNGVNFEIYNPNTSEKKIDHHDRLIPCKSGTNEDNDEIEFDTKRNQTDKGTKQFREIHHSDAMTSGSSEDEENSASSDATPDLESDTEDSNSDNATTPRQYPERLRRPRQFMTIYLGTLSNYREGEM